MGRKPSIEKETPREKDSRGIRKAVLRSIRGTALDGIKEIRPRIHRMVLSGQKIHRTKYRWEALNKTFEGSLHLNENYHPSDRSGNYGAMCIINRPDFQINLLLNRLKPFLPPIQIEIHPRRDIPLIVYKDFLVWLNKAIPGLNLSSVEYTIDQFCYSPFDVDNVSWVEWYSLYVPYIRDELRPVGGGYEDDEQGIAFDRKNRKAFIWNIGEKDKIYERGDDDKKKGDTWDYEDLNRVRLEHTTDRRELVRKGLRSLKDFIENPKFYEINKNVWYFRKWKETSPKKLIKEWDVGGGPFLVLFKETDLRNPTKYTEAVETLQTVEKRITDAMKGFDIEWNETPCP